MSTPDASGGSPTLSTGSAPGSPENEEPRRRTPGPSLRPALVVVGVALLLVLAFGIGAALTRNRTPKAPEAGAVKGTGLVGQPATLALRPIEIPGTPPADVLDALALPKGADKVSVTKWSGSTQYSGKMSFRAGASQAALVHFFRAELHARGWSIVDVGPARGEHDAMEVLAQRASTDGWYWEAGVVVFPTTFGHGAAAADVTQFTLEVYEMPDAT